MIPKRGEKNGLIRAGLLLDAMEKGDASQQVVTLKKELILRASTGPLFWIIVNRSHKNRPEIG